MDFDVIPYEDITWGKRLGSGSFGSVYKGSYLGIDIAIKEVLPSTEYDVHKYFEREWRIMRECRHPNIVLFLGLSKAIDGDGRVFIVSEFVPQGNLRQYILSARPFPWRLRLSFATDVARAVAYLHARQCIHRDLKGENLLITSNERIKVTDFGFARIASRNADEMRRMTYCGTDGYMSPEIIHGFEFSLPTDVFSLGIIFTEILSRRLVDSKTFIRQAPAFMPDPDEVRRRASHGCPPAFVSLALQCCLEDPAARPKMPEVLARLREIELVVLSRLDNEMEHVGSIRIPQHTGKRALPIFEPVKVDTADTGGKDVQREDDGDESESDQKMEEDALEALAKLRVDGQGAAVPEAGEVEGTETWRTARWEERPSVMTQWSDASEMRGHQRLIPSAQTSSSFEAGPPSDCSASLLRATPITSASAVRDAAPPDETTSTMTIRASPPTSVPAIADPADPMATAVAQPTPQPIQATQSAPTSEGAPLQHPPPANEIAKIPTKAERADEEAARKAAPPAHGTHRFTLIEKEALQLLSGKKPSTFPSTFAAFLPKALAPSNKCPVCHKRIGQRPALQCDDCTIIVHVKCSHAAARDCKGDEELVIVDGKP